MAAKDQMWEKLVVAGMTRYYLPKLAQRWFQFVVNMTMDRAIQNIDAMDWTAQSKHLAAIGQGLQFAFRALDVPAATYQPYREDVWMKYFVGIPGYGLTATEKDDYNYGKKNSVHRFLPPDLVPRNGVYACQSDDMQLKKQAATNPPVDNADAMFGEFRARLHRMWKAKKPNDSWRMWAAPRMFLGPTSYFNFQGPRYFSVKGYFPDADTSAAPLAQIDYRNMTRDTQWKLYDFMDDPQILGENEEAIAPRGDGGPPREAFEVNAYDERLAVLSPSANEYFDEAGNQLNANDYKRIHKWDVWGIGRPAWYQVFGCDVLPMFYPAKWCIKAFRETAQAALRDGMESVVRNSHAYAIYRNLKVAKAYFGPDSEFADMSMDLYAASQKAKFEQLSERFKPNDTVNTIAKVTQAAGMGVGAIPTPFTAVAGLVLGVAGKVMETVNGLSVRGGGGGFTSHLEDDMGRPKPVFEKTTLTGIPSNFGLGTEPRHVIPAVPGTDDYRDPQLAARAPLWQNDLQVRSPDKSVSDPKKQTKTPNNGTEQSILVPIGIGVAAVGAASAIAYAAAKKGKR
jgi:hypothetical protein